MTGDHSFHRPQSLAALPDAGLEVSIEAKPKERVGLATYLDVVSVEDARAALLIQRWRGQGVRVTGTVEAKVTQSCVTTLEPFKARVSCEIDRKFLPEAMLGRDADPHELVIDPEGEDPPDPLPHSLDLGELAAEELALNIDPYPRKPGLPETPDEDPAPARESPFAALKDVLKR